MRVITGKVKFNVRTCVTVRGKTLLDAGLSLEFNELNFLSALTSRDQTGGKKREGFSCKRYEKLTQRKSITSNYNYKWIKSIMYCDFNNK